MSTFSKKEAFRYGWNTFKAQPWVYIGASLLIVVLSLIFGKLNEHPNDMSGFLLSVIGTVLQWWVFLGFTRMALGVYAGTPPRFDMLFQESWKTVLWYGAIAIISAIAAGIGFILLIVPGFIVYTMVAFAPLLLLDRGLTAIPALKESRELSKGHRMNIFLFIILIVLLNIAGMIVFGVGLLVTVPVSLFAYVYAYKQIEKGIALEPVAAPAAPVAPAAPTTRA